MTFYHIESDLSRTFFKFFQNLFSIVSPSGPKPFIKQPVYFSTSQIVCQPLFLSFFRGFRSFLRRRTALADSFDILAHESRFVKHFFTVFYFSFCVLLPAYNCPPSTHSHSASILYYIYVYAHTCNLSFPTFPNLSIQEIATSLRSSQ